MSSARISAQKSSDTVVYVSTSCTGKFCTVNSTKYGNPPPTYDDFMMAGSASITPISSQVDDVLRAKTIILIWYPAMMFLLVDQPQSIARQVLS